MRKVILHSILLLAAVAMLADTISEAKANDLSIIYTGTVAGGFDYVGIFDSPNTTLMGSTFTAVFTVDTSKGVFSTTGYDGYIFSNGVIAGGPYWSSTPVTATLTIRGRTIEFDGSFRGLDYVYIPTNSNSPLRQAV